MGFFDAFYVMSYTATTIGFGEIPYPFTYSQRMWVTISIYLTVIGWAYAIGSLLALLQDRAFRQALARQHFTRKVARLREPFVLIAGYGRTGELLGHSLDALGRRFVVLDVAGERIDALELDSYHADVPGLAADARDPGHLAMAGLDHASCEAVRRAHRRRRGQPGRRRWPPRCCAPTLPVDRPGRPRRTLAERMQAFGTPEHGQPVRPLRRPPAARAEGAGVLPAADLAGERARGARCPSAAHRRATGRWVVCGYGRLGRELTADLRAEDLEVTVIDPNRRTPDGRRRGRRRLRPRGCMAQADLDRAVGFVAGTDNDTTNLSLVAAARRINPDLFVGARQNRAGQRAAVRRDGARRAARADRDDRPRGLRAAVARRCCGASCRRCRRRATPGPPS